MSDESGSGKSYVNNASHLTASRTEVESRELRRRLVIVGLSPIAAAMATLGSRQGILPVDFGASLFLIGAMAIARLFGANLYLFIVPLVLMIWLIYRNPIGSAWIAGTLIGAYAVCEGVAMVLFGDPVERRRGSVATSVDAIIRSSSSRWDDAALRSAEPVKYVYQRVTPDDDELILGFRDGETAYLLTNKRLHVFKSSYTLGLFGPIKRQTYDLERVREFEESSVGVTLHLDGGAGVELDDLADKGKLAQLLREIASEGHGAADNAAANDGDGVSHSASLGHPELDALVQRTQVAWREHVDEGISRKQSEQALRLTLDEFTRGVLTDAPYLLAALRARSFKDDEYLISWVANQFVLTNQAVYAGGADEMLVAPLCDVRTYSNKGWWRVVMTIELNDGRQFVKKLDSAPHPSIINALIELNRT